MLLSSLLLMGKGITTIAVVVSIAASIAVICPASTITTTATAAETTSATPTTAIQTLSVDNFDDITTDHNVFIRFCTPYSSECRSLTDVWTRLATEWIDHPIGIIADVDCSDEINAKPICDDFDIMSYPTLLVYYGDDPLIHVETYDPTTTAAAAADENNNKDTHDGYDYKSLSKYAKDHLSTLRCSPLRLDACTQDESLTIETLQSKSLVELNQIVDHVTRLVDEQEIIFDQHVQNIQRQYEQYVMEFNTKMEDIKTTYDYHFVEQIVALKSVEEQETEETETAEDEGNEL